LMHGTGMLGSFPFLHLGLPQVVLRQFDAAQVIDAVLGHRVTSTFFVPGMVTRLADAASAAERRLTPPLRRILYGGAPVDSQALRRAFDIIGPVLVQLYGRFEGGWPLAVLGIEEHRAGPTADRLLGRSCGKPIPQTEIKLRPVPNQPAGVGELCVRNGMVVREAANPDGWCALG
jgi:acyl-CoA synthetase (AMP-forming)/AMP-acid ligase II